jgi:regulator of protease activity HflC (stomatin/prohibitin superfamily)
MAADHVSYQRARSISLIGLALQLVFGVMLLLYALFGRDAFATPAAILVLLGSPIWVALALVFHQHVLERLEAAEAAAFRESEAAAASVFEGGAADINVQASRLQWMHKYLLPIVGLVLGGAHIAVGVWLYTGRPDAGDFEMPGLGGLGLAIGAIGALVAFIFARYAAGMAKEKVWLLLNAGAGAAVGMTLLGALLAVAHFLAATTDTIWLLNNTRAIVGIYAIVLGAEMALNFVLNLYRPRAAGEYLRPSFDSRVLAYIAAPDRLAQSISDAINYQFGFTVSTTWFYQLLSRWVLVLIGVMVLIGWLMTSFVVVAPHERGLLLAGGENRGVVEPGPVVKAPWPLSRVERFPATALNDIRIGDDPTQGDEQSATPLWADEDTPGELMFIIQPASDRPADDDATGGQDLSIAPVQVQVLYLIDDVERYYMLAQDGPPDDRDRFRAGILTALAGSETTAFLGSVPFDQLIAGLTPAQSRRLLGQVQERFSDAEAGVRVASVSLIGASPPNQVALALESAFASVNERTAAVQAAEAEADGILAQAAGSADDAEAILSQIRRADEVNRELNAARDAAESADRISELERRLAQAEADLAQTIVDGGGRAAAVLAEARGDRRSEALRARGESFRYEGRSALYAAAPAAYRAQLFWQNIREAVRGRRVWVVPDGVYYDLEQLEITQTLDIAPPGEGEE